MRNGGTNFMKHWYIFFVKSKLRHNEIIIIVLRIQIQERKLIEILLKEIEIESYILKHFDG